MMYRLLMLTLLLIPFSLGLSQQAQQASQTITLEQAINVAMEKNVSMITSQASVEKANGATLAAYGSYLPTLSASAGWNRTQADQQAGTRIVGGQVFVFPQSFNVSNNFSTGLNLNYLVFDGFNRESGYSGAKSNAQSSEDLLLRSRQTTTNLVENAYLNVLRLEQLVKVADENLKRDNRQLERISESNKVGAVALADVYRQQTAVASDELLLIQAQNNYDKSRADLEALIGLDMSLDYKFVDATIPSRIDSVEMDSTRHRCVSVADLSGRALAARPDYLSAQENLNAATSGVTQARSGYFPSISASAGFNLTNTELQTIADNKNLSWGINLRWNIFDAFRTNMSLQAAQAGEVSARASLDQAQRDITGQVKKAILDIDAATKQVYVSHKGLVSATEDRKIAEEKYNLGAGTLLDLLTANAGLVNAEANDVNATYNYITAKKNLEYTIAERVY